MDYELASNVFNIYRQLYNGSGAVALAKEFAYTAKYIVDNIPDLDLACEELYQDMRWAHDGVVPVDRETWFMNTCDLLEVVVRRMEKYPKGFRLRG